MDDSRNNPDAASSAHSRALRKFRTERLIGRYLANPAVRGLNKVGISTNLATDLETVGRKSGQPRRVPVAARFDETGAWLVSQHGRRAGWAHNIAADPAVRIRQHRRWRNGVAEFRPEDDVVARTRTFAANRLFAPLTVASFRALQSDPISVRITFTD